MRAVSRGGRNWRTRWAAAGEALRACDPVRFAAVLELAERIVAIHTDPMNVRVRRTGRSLSRR